MHPSTAKFTIDAHARDLQRLMHPAPKDRPRRRLTWIRKSR